MHAASACLARITPPGSTRCACSVATSQFSHMQPVTHLFPRSPLPLQEVLRLSGHSRSMTMMRGALVAPPRHLLTAKDRNGARKGWFASADERSCCIAMWELGGCGLPGRGGGGMGGGGGGMGGGGGEPQLLIPAHPGPVAQVVEGNSPDVGALLASLGGGVLHLHRLVV